MVDQCCNIVLLHTQYLYKFFLLLLLLFIQWCNQHLILFSVHGFCVSLYDIYPLYLNTLFSWILQFFLYKNSNCSFFLEGIVHRQREITRLFADFIPKKRRFSLLLLQIVGHGAVDDEVVFLIFVFFIILQIYFFKCTYAFLIFFNSFVHYISNFIFCPLGLM